MYLLYLQPKKGPKFPGTQRTGGQGPATSRYVFKLASNLLLPHLKLVSNLLLPHSIQVIRAPVYQTFKLRGLHSEDNTQRTTLRGPVPGAGRGSAPWTLDPIQWVPTVWVPGAGRGSAPWTLDPIQCICTVGSPHVATCTLYTVGLNCIPCVNIAK